MAAKEEGQWLNNIGGSWRDTRCPCGSTFHFRGKVDELFAWERIHLRHMASDSENHEMLSFYPKDMVIIYHSASGYVVERRRHRREEINEVHQARLYGNAKLAGV
ncbi:MAG: hypothetical protein ABI348_07960 [Nitrososphaera sp.]